MNTRLRFYSKLPFPKERLTHKAGELTLQKHDLQITVQGKFMVAGPNIDGLCEVIFQYLDQIEMKWIRIYLKQKYVDTIVFPKNENDLITCEDVLENGIDLTKKTSERLRTHTTVRNDVRTFGFKRREK